jgi:threonylcarbamoyladenosine tRNA methylthiotransferase MtaB
LLDLIKALEGLDALERIRISSIEPTTIPDELIDHMGVSSKLCPYLHVPLQSGDDRILKAMNRRYAAQDYRTLIEKAARRVPDIGLGTDVMVGFPGEGEQEFAQTLALLSELPFSYFHVFSYSERPGTAAARLSYPVQSAAMKARSKMLAELSRAKRLASYQSQIGCRVRVLFENRETGDPWTGLTGNYMRVGVNSSDDLTNRIMDVLITGVMDGLAVGQLVEY